MSDLFFQGIVLLKPLSRIGFCTILGFDASAGSYPVAVCHGVNGAYACLSQLFKGVKKVVKG